MIVRILERLEKSIIMTALFLLSMCPGSYAIETDSISKLLENEKDPCKRAELFLKKVDQEPEPSSALEQARKALQEAKKSKTDTCIMKAKYTYGYVLSETGDMAMGIQEMLEALRLAEKHKDTVYISQCYVGLGLAYADLDQPDNSKAQYLKAIALWSEEDDRALKVLDGIYNNLGTAYKDLDMLDSALFYHNKALSIRLKFNDEHGLSYCYNNIGLIFKRQGDLDKAIEYMNKSLEIKERLNDIKGIAGSNINIGNLFLAKNQPQKALAHIEKGIELAKKAQAIVFLMNGVRSAAKTHAKMNHGEETVKYYEEYIILRDSLINTENLQAISELETKYETEKKQQEIETQKLELDKQRAEKERLDVQASRKNVLLITVSFILLLILILAFVIFRNQQKQKSINALLNFRNKEIEQKNKDITDSINYAKKIQQSLLPDQEILKIASNDFFILYQPKDIVSGDFYWFKTIGNVTVVAVGDCTGHGVPGALLMSVCVSLLDQAVSDQSVSDPGTALEIVDEKLKTVLGKSAGTQSADGMDIGLCVIDAQKRKIQFAGANRPLYYFAKNQLTEIKGTRRPIGGRLPAQQPFESHDLILEKGDSIYLFSDGVTDQFGWEGNKKFLSKRLRETLNDFSTETMENQKVGLKKALEAWMGELEQVDDICMIGIRV